MQEAVTNSITKRCDARVLILRTQALPEKRQSEDVWNGVCIPSAFAMSAGLTTVTGVEPGAKAGPERQIAVRAAAALVRSFVIVLPSQG
jgi:hypothetical protein